MEITIRELKEEDIPPPAEIEAESFSMPWSAQDFRDLLSHPYCHYLVAEADGRVAGCCGFTNACGVANVDNVVVAPKLRGQGIAQMLMGALIDAGEAEQVEPFPWTQILCGSGRSDREPFNNNFHSRNLIFLIK